MFNYSQTALTTMYVILGNLVLFGFVLETLRRAKASVRLRASSGLVLLIWQALLAWRLLGSGLFPASIDHVIFCAILFGLVAAVCAASFLTPIRTALLQLPYESLLLPQGLRVFFGAGFLIEGVLGQLPVGFSIADGIFHITSAFLALKAGLLFAQRGDNLREIWFANLFGLCDIVIVALGIPFALLDKVGPNHNMMFAAFFAAPLFVVFHFFSLLKLAGVEGGAK